MLIRNTKYASLTLATLLLTGCESQPPAGSLPVRVASSASTGAPPAATGSTSSAPASASSGFSLPIGADIPRATPGSASTSATETAEPGQAPPSQSTVAAANSSAPGQGPFVHLSAGIAVPQSLPVGTVMAISVDYSLSAELKGSSRYALVVKSAAGEIVSEVKLEPSGNLSAFFQQLKPEHRPFSARIEEVTPGSKRRTLISNELPLKTDY